MTNLEKEALLSCAKRLNKLASLENASFHMDEEKDKEIKKAITPYMSWFESVAMDIEKIVELTEEKGFIKKEQLDEIIKFNLM